MVIASIVQKLSEIINLSFLGHQTFLDSETLTVMMAGAGLGLTTQNLLALSFVFGLNQTVETLVSQAWGAG